MTLPSLTLPRIAPTIARAIAVGVSFFAATLFAAPPTGSLAASANTKWQAELVGTEGGSLTTYPNNLGWQADHPASYPSPFLVVGMRPSGDRTNDGVRIRGQKRTAADWVVSDGTDAIWVTGLPAPKPGKPVVFTGRFTTDGALALKGIRFLVAAEPKGKTLARPGDFVVYPLAGNKSNTVPVETEGDAAELAFTDERDTLIVRAVRPGTAKIRFFSLGFADDKPTLQSERILAVE